MKKLLLIFSILFFSLAANAQTLQGGISYTESQARDLAFDRVVLNIDMGDLYIPPNVA
ncbi:hypothetical protein tpqmel_0025 [Candidatus Gastranaerophilus sp. (ex Termes propinquus)]|nr:hypothetical protein tpqmel_0025 [Candidatus Gastranaerophilus sp. (ex Termes propinquus)]